eukprot:TRINITY_DN21288_c0_g1_i1.p1 TRINITY_DN21288_c0_g1~~TRINITY_DN21288_c0_g1_i1.p1  ORF type:complete len:1178 (-),score=163.79 TRINITY_DN21288_c0_g1_i1:570-4103(-)
MVVPSTGGARKPQGPTRRQPPQRAAATPTTSRRPSMPAGTSSSEASGQAAPSTPGQATRATSGAQAAAEAKAAAIRVVVRIRPKLSHEQGEDECIGRSDGRHVALLSAAGAERLFAFDQVFDSRVPECSQSVFYNGAAADLVSQALQGFNICIFAFGHTGSGKTFSMLGDGSTRIPKTQGGGAGVVPRFLRDIFQAHVKDSTCSNAKYRCEYFEVYNERVVDLLAADQKRAERQRTIHVHPKHGVRVDGLSTSVVTSVEGALELLLFGNQMRTVACTTMNARSSRSHAIFTFRFSCGEGRYTRESSITFVDLAGREEQVGSSNEDMRFKEMCYINTSLFHLGHLITKLADGNVNHGALTDFRNSKLTLLLSQAVSGNSRTALIATLASSRCFYDDALSTLNFAQSVKRIKTSPTVNNMSSNKVVSELENEVAQLRRALESEKAEKEERARELLAAENLINEYKRTWEETQHESQLTHRARCEASVRMGIAEPTLPRGAEKIDGHAVPFLTKLSDDWALQGCVNYFLSGHCVKLGSDESTCEIRLQGVGIFPIMCEILCDPMTSVVTVQLHRAQDDDDELWTDTEDQPRVCVNGKCLSDHETSLVLSHGESLVLGYSHAFRLVVPTAERLRTIGEWNAAALARKTVPALDVDSAISDAVTTHASSVSPSQGTPISEEFAASVKSLNLLVGEANLLTKQVLGETRIRFRVRQLTASTVAVGDDSDDDDEQRNPTLCVCMTIRDKIEIPTTPAASRRGTEARSFRFGSACTPTARQSMRRSRALSNLVPGPRKSMALSLGLDIHMMMGDLDALLYIWSIDKFLRRLSAMRDVYEQCELLGEDGFAKVRSRLRSESYLNPWQELAFADVKMAFAGAKIEDPVAHATNPDVQRKTDAAEALAATPSDAGSFRLPMASVPASFLAAASGDAAAGGIADVAIADTASVDAVICDNSRRRTRFAEPIRTPIGSMSSSMSPSPAATTIPSASLIASVASAAESSAELESETRHDATVNVPQAAPRSASIPPCLRLDRSGGQPVLQQQCWLAPARGPRRATSPVYPRPDPGNIPQVVPARSPHHSPIVSPRVISVSASQGTAMPQPRPSPQVAPSSKPCPVPQIAMVRQPCTIQHMGALPSQPGVLQLPIGHRATSTVQAASSLSMGPPAQLSTPRGAPPQSLHPVQ